MLYFSEHDIRDNEGYSESGDTPAEAFAKLSDTIRSAAKARRSSL